MMKVFNVLLHQLLHLQLLRTLISYLGNIQSHMNIKIMVVKHLNHILIRVLQEIYIIFNPLGMKQNLIVNKFLNASTIIRPIKISLRDIATVTYQNMLNLKIVSHDRIHNYKTA